MLVLSCRTGTRSEVGAKQVLVLKAFKAVLVFGLSRMAPAHDAPKWPIMRRALSASEIGPQKGPKSGSNDALRSRLKFPGTLGINSQPRTFKVHARGIASLAEFVRISVTVWSDGAPLPSTCGRHRRPEREAGLLRIRKAGGGEAEIQGGSLRMGCEKKCGIREKS